MRLYREVDVFTTYGTIAKIHAPKPIFDAWEAACAALARAKSIHSK